MCGKMVSKNLNFYNCKDKLKNNKGWCQMNVKIWFEYQNTVISN